MVIKRNIINLVVLAALLLPAIISCDSRERLYIYNWTYYIPDSVIEKFEEEFNVRVIYDEFASNEEMFAKLRSTRSSRGSYDVVFPSGYYIPIMIREDMLEKIDKSKIENLKNIDAEVLAKAAYDPAMEYSVPYFYGAAAIIINTVRVPVFEKSWSIFAREDLRGRMTMLDDLREVMGDALTYLGYSVNTVNPVQIAQARDLVNNSWKPNLVKFDAETFGKGYANEDFWVVHGYPEVVFEEIADNEQLLANTVIFIPEEGGPSYIDAMVILKNARNIDLAHKFINFIHRPDIFAEFTDIFGLPATVNIPARRLKQGVSVYSEEELHNTELTVDIGDSLELYNDAWFNVVRAGY
ncbi:MAG: extracellular solute-binding protein [Treponema sp.]|jgi:spermidine/putrescine transport system substrate-binding protein|nr:extracellular solute-binding protein [Treponema sp.]